MSKDVRFLYKSKQHDDHKYLLIWMQSWYNFEQYSWVYALVLVQPTQPHVVQYASSCWKCLWYSWSGDQPHPSQSQRDVGPAVQYAPATPPRCAFLPVVKDQSMYNITLIWSTISCTSDTLIEHSKILIMDLIHYSVAPLVLFRVPYMLDLLP